MWWRRKKRESKVIKFDDTQVLLNKIIEVLNRPDNQYKRIRKIRKIFDIEE